VWTLVSSLYVFEWTVDVFVTGPADRAAKCPQRCFLCNPTSEQIFLMGSRAGTFAAALHPAASYSTSIPASSITPALFPCRVLIRVVILAE
jgi:hypothetical protein